MKQAATDPGFEFDGALGVAGIAGAGGSGGPGGPGDTGGGCGREGARGFRAIRAARAHSVRALFGLWLGLFSFTLAWALARSLGLGALAAPQGVWVQLVALVAAVMFYLGAKSLRRHRAALPLAALPVTLSLIASLLAFGTVLARSGPAGLVPQGDPAFWTGVRDAHFGNAFGGPAVRTVDGPGLDGAMLPAIYRHGAAAPGTVS